MRRFWLLVVWLVGTTAAVGISYRAIAFVDGEVGSDRPTAVLSAAAVGDALDDSTSSTSTSTSTSTTNPGSSPSSTVVTVPTTPVTVDDGGGDRSSTTVTAPTSPPPGATGETRTVTALGGSAGVQFHPDGTVELLWAQPAAGFTMSVHDDGPFEVHVRFQRDDHRSDVWGEWEDGAPRTRVEEEER